MHNKSILFILFKYLKFYIFIVLPNLNQDASLDGIANGSTGSSSDLKQVISF